MIEGIIDLIIIQPPTQGYKKSMNYTVPRPLCTILTQSPTKQLLNSRTNLTLGQEQIRKLGTQ